MILREHQPSIAKGQSILKVASHFHSVRGDARIAQLADAFNERPELMAVAVLDAADRPLGIVSRVGLFSLLGRAFGRDIMGKKSLDQALEAASCFERGDNLFTVGERLGAQLDRAVISYYLICDDQGRFEALFSSQDLLLFLSRVLAEDIALTGQLQDRMMQGGMDQSLGGVARVQGFSLYAKGVGGDFYQVIRISEHQWFLALCDVSGKGVAASFMTALLWGLIRMYDFSQGLRKLIAKLNQALIESFHLEKYLTGLFMLLDSQSGKLVWADMGHGHAFIKRGGRVLPLRGEKLNLPIGLDLGLEPYLYSSFLRPGEEILVFTDGLVEQLNPAGEEYGEERLLAQFQSGGDFLGRLRADFGRFKAERCLHDDTSVLHLVYGGETLAQQGPVLRGSSIPALKAGLETAPPRSTARESGVPS